MTIVKLVSDTTCDLPSKIVKDLDMEIVPLKVIMDGEEFTAGQELTSEEFYILLPTLNEIPTTSQPSPKKFFQVYTEIPDNYDLIISLHISRKMSGTLNSAEKAKKMLPSKPIEIFDSKNTGAALGLLLLEINERIKELETKNEIITQVDELIPQIKTIGYAGTLKYLIKGGRIGKAKGLIGKLLGTLPILKIENGEVDSVTTIRGSEKALDFIIDFLIKENVSKKSKIALTHGNIPDVANSFAKRIKREFGCQILFINTLSPIIGTHLGPGSIFIAYLP